MAWSSRRTTSGSNEDDVDHNDSGPFGARSDPEAVARGVVLRRLALAARTRFELSEDLVARGIPIDVIDLVLDRFTEVGLIDDEQFALGWVASRQRTRGAARSVLRQELRRKGISDDHTEAALLTISAESEHDRARLMVERKLMSMQGMERTKSMRRLVSLLARRGYPTHLAMSVVNEALDSPGVQIDD